MVTLPGPEPEVVSKDADCDSLIVGLILNTSTSEV